MTKRKRQILVLLLFTTFFVVAPLVLLFASGYSYSWTKNRIEKTGIIYVDAEPDDAEVWLNDKRVLRSLPISVTRLLPEDYEVSIERAGYLPWSKTLAVNSGQTTFAKTIHLLPDTLPQLTAPAPVTQSVFSDDGRSVVFMATNEEWLELVHLDLMTNQELLLARFGAEKFAKTELSFSPDGSHLLLDGQNAADNQRTVNIYTIDETATALGIKELANANELDYCWSDNSKIVFSTGRKIISASMSERKIDSLFANGSSGIADLLCTDNNYWLITNDESQEWLTRLPKDNPLLPQQIMKLPNSGNRFVSGKEDLLWLANDRLEEGLAIKPAEANSFAVPYATNLSWEFADSNGRVLLWNDYELFLIDFVQPRPVLVTRLGTPIHGAAWHPSGNYALFSTGTGITTIELDGRDQRNIYRLVEFSDINSLTVNRDDELLYFVGSIGQQRGIFERPL